MHRPHVFGIARAPPRIDDFVRTVEMNGTAEPRKWRRVIRVPIPIDIGTIAATGGSAFAFATPFRVDRLIALAVAQSCGERAPREKRERHIRATLDGFLTGKFVVDIDGRLFDRPDAVVVCSGVATLRFFLREPSRRERRTAL